MFFRIALFIKITIYKHDMSRYVFSVNLTPEIKFNNIVKTSTTWQGDKGKKQKQKQKKKTNLTLLILDRGNSQAKLL